MKGRRPGAPGAACVFLIVLGVLVIMALVLPPGFWWLLLGVVLILLGLKLGKRF